MYESFTLLTPSPVIKASNRPCHFQTPPHGQRITQTTITLLKWACFSTKKIPWPTLFGKKEKKRYMVFSTSLIKPLTCPEMIQWQVYWFTWRSTAAALCFYTKTQRQYNSRNHFALMKQETLNLHSRTKWGVLGITEKSISSQTSVFLSTWSAINSLSDSADFNFYAAFSVQEALKSIELTMQVICMQMYLETKTVSLCHFRINSRCCLATLFLRNRQIETIKKIKERKSQGVGCLWQALQIYSQCGSR